MQILGTTPPFTLGLSHISIGLICMRIFTVNTVIFHKLLQHLLYLFGYVVIKKIYAGIESLYALLVLFLKG